MHSYIQCIKPPGLLNAIVVDGFMRLIERRSEEGIAILPRVLCLDSFFSSLRRQRHALALRRFRHANPFEYDLVLIPLFLPGGCAGHWALVVGDMKEKRIYTLDSLGMEHRSYAHYLIEILEEYSKLNDVPWSSTAWYVQDTPQPCPKQTKNTDCGVYMLWFAEQVSLGHDIPTDNTHPFHPDQWRDYVRECLNKKHIQGPHNVFDLVEMESIEDMVHNEYHGLYDDVELMNTFVEAPTSMEQPPISSIGGPTFDFDKWFISAISSMEQPLPSTSGDGTLCLGDELLLASPSSSLQPPTICNEQPLQPRKKTNRRSNLRRVKFPNGQEIKIPKFLLHLKGPKW